MQTPHTSIQTITRDINTCDSSVGMKPEGKDENRRVGLEGNRRVQHESKCWDEARRVKENRRVRWHGNRSVRSENSFCVKKEEQTRAGACMNRKSTKKATKETDSINRTNHIREL